MAEGTSSHLEKLDFNNYPTWRYRMSILLKAKGLWSTMEDEPPADGVARAQWDKKDLEAVNILVQSLSAAQTSYVINQTKAKGIWRKLEEVNRGRIVEKKITLKRELNGIQWTTNEDAAHYMHRVESICEQLRSLGEVLEEAEVAAIAIQGLPPSYHGVARSFDVCATADITLEKVRYALLQEQQRQQRQPKESKESFNEAACNARVPSTRHRQDGKEVKYKCFHCGKPGHFAKNCWHRRSDTGRSGRPPPRHNERQGSWKNDNRRQTAGLVKSSTDDKKQERVTAEFAFGTSEKAWNSESWSIDSGATSHMTGCKNVLRDFKRDTTRHVIVADGKTIDAEGSGTVIFKVQDDVDNMLTAKDVLYVPGITDSLISVAKLTDSGMDVVFEGDVCTVHQGGDFVFSGTKVDGVYKMRAEAIPVHERADHVMGDDVTTLWHRRMGHLNFDQLLHMSRTKAVSGLPHIQKSVATCEPCIIGKHPREPFHSSQAPGSAAPLDLLHVDVCGPFPVNSIGGSKYLLVIVDDYSRRVAVHFLTHKSEATDALTDYIRTAETQIARQVKRIRTDNGGEFVNDRLAHFLRHKGIIHEKTAPYSPAQNGIAERMNRTLVETARALLHEAGLPPVFWAEAVNTAAYVRNRCSKRLLNGKVPEEIYSQRYQSVRHFKVFGCLAYAWIPAKHRGKLDGKSRAVIFLGYSQNRKAYRLYDPATNEFIASRDVKFLEEKKGSSLLNPIADTSGQLTTVTRTPGQWTDQFADGPADAAVAFGPDLTDESERPIDECRELPDNEDTQSSTEHDDSLGESPQEPSSSDHDDQPAENLPLRRSTRIRRPPERLQVDPKKASYCDMAAEEPTDPRSYDQAMSSPQRTQWVEAMKQELASLHDMKTWVLVPRKPDMKVVRSKWVYRIKRDAAGNIDKYKARLVAVGCSQVEGVDYFETFSPVVKLTSLRILLALGLNERMVMRQLDVKTAYLHGKLDETVYMEPPLGCPGTDGKVCLLKKALYGLKQSGRMWYLTLDDVLRKQGYRRLESDRCVYVLSKGRDKVVLSVYVDDMLMMATSPEALNSSIKNLGKEVELKDLGEPTYILGIEVSHDKNNKTLTISQKKYIDEILRRYKMEDSKPVKTPMDAASRNNDSEGVTASKVLNAPYQNLIGNLMYLVQGTRPDLAFATSFLSQFNQNPTETHWKMAKRVLRYIKGTQNVGITYTTCQEPIIGYCDASWNECSTGRSRSGYVYTMSRGAISWKSARQQLVALSTCEAEYVSMAESLKEGKWIKTFMGELDFGSYGTGCLEVRCDNQSAIKIAENPTFHQRTKHIGLKYLFARNEIENRNFTLTFLPTEEMIADVLTKPVTNAKNIVCAKGFGFVNFH